VALDLNQFHVVFTVFMAYMIWWTIRFYVMFRRPKGDERRSSDF